MSHAIAYHIGKAKRWTVRWARMVAQMGRNTDCPDSCRLRRKRLGWAWICIREHLASSRPPCRIPAGAYDTGPCRKRTAWCSWWCAAGRLIRRCRSDDCRIRCSSVADVCVRWIDRWCRTWWYHRRQWKLSHDPIIEANKYRDHI